MKKLTEGSRAVAKAARLWPCGSGTISGRRLSASGQGEKRQPILHGGLFHLLRHRQTRLIETETLLTDWLTITITALFSF